MLHGYSDRIHHALAFTAKHYPEPVSRYDDHSCLIRASSVAVILARYDADEPTIVAAILKQLVDACPHERQESLTQHLERKFGAQVAAAVREAMEPRFDVLGRERTWKACRFEYMARLAGAAPRSVDVVVAHEMHQLGSALVSIRRLGVEYLEVAGLPHSDDVRWWHRTLLDTLESHAAWRRAEMCQALIRLTEDLESRLPDRGL